MSSSDVDLALQSKREQVIVITKFLIATVSTILGWKCFSTGLSPLETDFGASTLFIIAILVFVAALRARLIWNHSVWPEMIYDLAELAGLLASVSLVVILNRPFGWFAFGAWALWLVCITFRWLQNLHPNYVMNIQAFADKLHELVHPAATPTQQPEHNSPPV